jgi:hypothetical protein
MKFGPVRTGQNTFPGASPESKPDMEVLDNELSKSEDPLESASADTLEETLPPKKEVITPQEVFPEPSNSKFSIKHPIKIEWKGCIFNVSFDNVWIQNDSTDTDTPKWLVLVHDLSSNTDGPIWSPPTSVEPGEVTTLTIEHEGTAYDCSYFGLELIVPTHHLSLTTFLIVGVR